MPTQGPEMTSGLQPRVVRLHRKGGGGGGGGKSCKVVTSTLGELLKKEVGS